MSKLTLFWGERSEPSFYWVMTENESTNSSQKPIHRLESSEILKEDLSCIADMAAANQVSLIISCQDVFSDKVDVPNKSARLLRKAVPYTLEEELATPVEQLFFALDEHHKTGKLQVHAIERLYLESILEAFKNAEISLSEILVDIDSVAQPDEGYKIAVTQEQCMVIESNGDYWHSKPEDFSWLIQKRLNKDDEQEMPVAIPLDLYSQQPSDEFVHQLPVGRFAVNSVEVPSIYDWLIKSPKKAINLLQAEYEPKKENSQLNRFVIKVASLAGFVLVAHLIYQTANIFVLSDTKNQLEQQKITLYKQAFPAARKVKGAAGKMRAYVKSIGNVTGGGFLDLLNSSTEDLTDLTKIKPTNISFDQARNELRIDVIASDLVVLDQYAEALKKKGHRVSKSSETQRGDGYSSRLTITR